MVIFTDIMQYPQSNGDFHRLQVRQFYVSNSTQRSGNSNFKKQEEKRYLTFKSFSDCHFCYSKSFRVFNLTLKKKKYTQETVPKRSFSNICHSSEVALLKAFRLYNLQHIFLHIYLLMQIYI